MLSCRDDHQVNEHEHEVSPFLPCLPLLRFLPSIFLMSICYLLLIYEVGRYIGTLYDCSLIHSSISPRTPHPFSTACQSTSPLSSTRPSSPLSGEMIVSLIFGMTSTSSRRWRGEGEKDTSDFSLYISFIICKIHINI